MPLPPLAATDGPGGEHPIALSPSGQVAVGLGAVEIVSCRLIAREVRPVATVADASAERKRRRRQRPRGAPRVRLGPSEEVSRQVVRL